MRPTLTRPLERLTSHPHADEPGYSPEEEVALVERARAGERAAFGELVRAHYASLYATARHVLGNHEDAEDLVQEAFVRAHQGLAWYRSEGRFAGWMRRILVHLARDRFRAQGRRPTMAPLEAGPEPAGPRGPAAEAGARELERLVEHAIERLPVRLRVPLVLRVLDGLDYDDIATATGVTPATARTQVMQARRALARLLERHLELDEGGEASNRRENR